METPSPDREKGNRRHSLYPFLRPLLWFAFYFYLHFLCIAPASKDRRMGWGILFSYYFYPGTEIVVMTFCDPFASILVRRRSSVWARYGRVHQ